MVSSTDHRVLEMATTLAEAEQLLTTIEAEVAFRFTELQHAGHPDIVAYNAWATATAGEAPLSRIVVIIDELAMLLVGKAGTAFGERLTQLAQISRAAGVHLVCATQRPSSQSLPTQLRSQLTSRVACRVATATDSRMILDQTGAEKLLGAGDTLVAWAGAEMVRVQGTLITSEWREWLTTAVTYAWYVPPVVPAVTEPVAPIMSEPSLSELLPSTPSLPFWDRVKAWFGRGGVLA
jgi:S-DNA-T family DNA segregation ATPase FtsK/SpoIIIE